MNFVRAIAALVLVEPAVRAVRGPRYPRSRSVARDDGGHPNRFPALPYGERKLRCRLERRVGGFQRRAWSMTAVTASRSALVSAASTPGNTPASGWTIPAAFRTIPSSSTTASADRTLNLSITHQLSRHAHCQFQQQRRSLRIEPHGSQPAANGRVRPQHHHLCADQRFLRQPHDLPQFASQPHNAEVDAALL